MPDLLNKLIGRQSTPRPLPEDSDLEQFFTDAKPALQLFEDLVRSAPLPKRLLVIHGVGGVGKSTLLKMYRLFCYRHRIPVALVGVEDAPSSVDVLAAWAEDLSNTGIKLRAFPTTLDHYRALQAKVEAKAEQAKEAMSGAAGALGKAAAKTAVEMAVSTIPVVGPLVAALGGAGTEAAMDWLHGFLSKPDLEFYLDPSKRLTDDFLSDLTRAAARQRIVLMADTYEQMTAMDGWMRDLARQLPKNVLLVISGRAVPEWDRAWQSWMGWAEIIELQEMTADDQRTLVRRYCAYIHRGEPDPEQVEAIAKFSRGLPIAATTVVQLWVKHGVEDFHTVKAQVVADLADRLLEGVPPEMRPTFEAAAVLRYFNADSLRALLDEGVADALYAELRRWPFIHPRREGLAVHDTMREMMNEALHVRTPERFCNLHERAATYYEAQRTETTGEERERPTLELLYHRLMADESKGIDLLENLFEEANQLGQQELRRNLLNEASQHVLQEPQHRYRLQYLEARASRDWKEHESLFKALLGKDLDDALRVKVLRALTDPLSYQGKSAQALRYLEEALAICERRGDLIGAAWTRLELCWHVNDLDKSRNHIDLASKAFREARDERGLTTAEIQLGWNYLNRWQAVPARDAFLRSMTLAEKLNNRDGVAFIQERIGQACLIEGDFVQAIAFKEKALKVFEELQNEWSIAWTLEELATCYSWTGQWKLALALLERAQGIFVEWSDHRETACVVRQGEIYRKQGRLELAVETYQRALNTMPRCGTWTRQEIHAGMGYIRLTRGEFEEALADFQRAIAEFQANGKEFEARLVGEVYRGDLWLAQDRAANALEHYTLCLETAQSRDNHAFECRSLVGMCQAHYRQGNLDRFNVLVSQALGLGETYRYYQLLADIHVLQGYIALDRAFVDQEHLDAAVRFYGASLKDSLLYNRYKLDETVQAIIAHCHERGDECRQVIAALRDFWQTGINDEGVSLLEAERIAREREPGDGSPQVSVVEQIEQALKETELRG